MIRRPLIALTVCALAACATTDAERLSAAPPLAEVTDVTPLRPGPGRLPSLADPTLYEVALKVDPRLEQFSGVTRIHLAVKAPTRVLHFHAAQMTLRRVEAQVGTKTLPGTLAPASDPGARPEANEHVVTFAEPVPAGPVTLTFEHAAPFDQRLSGLYRAREGDDWYASSQFEVADAKKAFPCLDEPRWKVPFRITLEVPEGMGAFSNAPEKARETVNGWTRVHFADTRPIPTYLAAFAVGPFEVVDGGKAGAVPLRGLAPKGRGRYLAEGLKMHAELVPLLEAYFAQPYGFDKLDAVAVLEFAAGAMENPGLIVYREELLLLDEDHSSEASRRAVATVVAHELAHQWFGNLVTLAWWDDLWLNEAFAEWMAGKIVDEWRPELENGLAQLERRENMLNADGLSSALPIRASKDELNLTLGAQFYFATFKGAPLLSMLEQWIGPERFREGVRHYLAARKHQTATSDDLFLALERAAGSDKPVREVMSRFIDRAGAPVIRAELTCEANRAAVTLTQGRSAPLGVRTERTFPDGKPWLVPACVAYPVDGRVAQTCAQVEGEPVSVPLPEAKGCPAWIHPNAGESGYYRWELGADALRALQAGLQMPVSDPKSRQLLRRSGVAFMDQAWAMVSSGALSPADYLSITETLAKRGDRRQLAEVVTALGRVAETWEALAKTPAFAAFVRRVLEPHARELTWSRQRGDDADTLMLRPKLLAALANHGHSGWAIDGAAELAQVYLGAPEKVAPELAAGALAVAAANGRIDPKALMDFLDRAATPAQRLTAVSALGSLPAGKGLEDALRLLLTERIRLQDYRSLLTPAFDGPSRDAAFAELQRMWPELTRRASGFGGNGARQFVGIIGEYCDAEGRDRAIAFFQQQPMKSDRWMTGATEAANRCIAVRAHGRDSLSGFLKTGR